MKIDSNPVDLYQQTNTASANKTDVNQVDAESTTDQPDETVVQESAIVTISNGTVAASDTYNFGGSNQKPPP
jgi:hypothetical protein